ncbi:thermostable hemolysin [Vibrio genomosp. F10]|uniref:thermostable hemolysin n=1 Tax=Vibrio genomosp. F10 TaxID=723171 RepID=UPI0002DC35F8|nr:thermostable hemolysin [Vibrio genomosp. F10]OEF08628.1 delta-VPH [Vibrio genomosp. F10 str. 9ZB36]
MKHNTKTSVKNVTLEIVSPMHPLWEQVINHVSQRYHQAFNADLKQFMPAYLTLMNHDDILSVCGFSTAQDQRLFLEQYLDDDAQTLVASTFDCTVKRSNLVEFGHLASFANGMSSLHFYLIAEMLVDNGFEWCIFTATDPLHAMMVRLGLEPKIIANADQNKIPDAKSTWGSYYEHQPRVLAGNLRKGLERLQLIQKRMRKQA